MEPGYMALSIYCVHMSSKWSRVLDSQPIQGKDMSIEVYYDQFCIWKKKLEEVNYIGEEESYIDDFLYGLKMDLAVRVWVYKWKPRTLYGAFRRAEMEETMLSWKELSRKNDVDKVFEEMSQPNSINIADTIKVEGVPDEKSNGVRKLLDSEEVTENEITSEQEDSGPGDSQNEEDDFLHFKVDNPLVEMVGQSFPSKPEVVADAHHMFNEMLRPVLVSLNSDASLFRDEGNEYLSSVIKGLQTGWKLFDVMPKRISAELNEEMYAIQDYTSPFGYVPQIFDTGSSFLIDDGVILPFDPGGSFWFHNGCDLFEFTDGLGYRPGLQFSREYGNVSSGRHPIFTLIIDNIAHGDDFIEMDLKALFAEANSGLLMTMLSFDQGGCSLSQMRGDPFELYGKHGDICLEVNVDGALVKAKGYCAAKAFDEQLEMNGLSLRHVSSFEACKNIKDDSLNVVVLFSNRGSYVTCFSKGDLCPLISKASGNKHCHVGSNYFYVFSSAIQDIIVVKVDSVTHEDDFTTVDAKAMFEGVNFKLSMKSILVYLAHCYLDSLYSIVGLFDNKVIFISTTYTNESFKNEHFDIFSETSTERLTLLKMLFSTHWVKFAQLPSWSPESSTLTAGSSVLNWVKIRMEQICYYVNGCLVSNSFSNKAPMEHFEIICNMGVTGWSSVVLYAAFCSNILRNGGSEKLCNEAIDETIENSVKLFFYIYDKQGNDRSMSTMKRMVKQLAMVCCVAYSSSICSCLDKLVNLLHTLKLLIGSFGCDSTTIQVRRNKSTFICLRPILQMVVWCVHFTINQSILEALLGNVFVCVINLSKEQSVQWPTLLQAFASRSMVILTSILEVGRDKFVLLPPCVVSDCFTILISYMPLRFQDIRLRSLVSGSCKGIELTHNGVTIIVVFTNIHSGSFGAIICIESLLHQHFIVTTIAGYPRGYWKWMCDWQWTCQRNERKHPCSSDCRQIERFCLGSWYSFGLFMSPP